MKFSIIIPAHNEQAYIGQCLESIKRSSAAFIRDVEIIIVPNRCTDSTENIARAAGAKVVQENSRNLSKIRNAGIAVASGEIIVTLDADSIISENMLSEIDKALASQRYIGGGVPVRFERYSLGIRLAYFFLKIYVWLTGLSGGLFWCFSRDFEAVGGFNESLHFGEDLDFAGRLKSYGKKRGLKFITLHKVYITTSCRKFDKFGDWYLFRLMLFQRKKIKKWLQGEDTSFADKYFYDFNK